MDLLIAIFALFFPVILLFVICTVAKLLGVNDLDLETWRVRRDR